MDFILGQLRQLGMVVVIMACAIGGTVGILRLIRFFVPGTWFPGDAVPRKPEEGRDREG